MHETRLTPCAVALVTAKIVRHGLFFFQFLKRQDPLNVLLGIDEFACDQVRLSVGLQQIKDSNDEDMDTFVFAVGTKKAMG
ncbi:coiled-coil domain-containing protein 47 [Lates japonicus]|uniref:Coiled-coil domain-containing protein 47 n=1 Tax=Lates japonicus TaxID=270547 RepID=A0AAD3MK82_LATJO|nr:coiled-coil domain-containing protein 47 [Lates japonicus]